MALNNVEISHLIYEPLDPAVDEIRLLTLHPSSDTDSTLICTLSHASLVAATPPAYEALSYVWGKPRMSVPISLNGVTFYITPSLAYILSALRFDTQPRVLWIDALCINQSDLQERSQQVALMRSIYSCCQQDIAWLGDLPDNDPESGSDNQFAHISQQRLNVKEGIELLHQLIQKNPETLKSLQDKYRDLFPEHDQTEPDPIPDLWLDWDDERTLSHLFRLPTFWKRLWIVQELSLAPRVTLMCEGAELRWDALAALFKDEPYFDAFHVTDQHGMTRYFGDIFLRAKFIDDQRRMSATQDSSLLDVLARFREMESTDPRDKVYGLLGLVTQDHGIDVDYARPLSEVYQEATLSIINLSQNLDIICQSPFERQDRPHIPARVPDLASWAAEFHLRGYDCLPILFAQRGIFNAGSERLETPCRLLRDVLVLKGSVLGRIGPVFHVKPSDYEPPTIAAVATGIWRVYLGQDALNNHHYSPIFDGKPLPPRETLTRAYWRTLVKDTTLPPRMRRLREQEIESLDAINQDRLRNSKTLQTLQIPYGKLVSKSALSYMPGDDYDYAEIDDSGNLVATDGFYSSSNWIFTMSDNGLFVLARPQVEQGDVVAVLDGGKVPMILRKDGPDHECQDIGDVYRIVCSAYVHGFMDGEADEGVSQGWLKKEELLIA